MLAIVIAARELSSQRVETYLFIIAPTEDGEGRGARQARKCRMLVGCTADHAWARHHCWMHDILGGWGKGKRLKSWGFFSERERI